MLVVGCAVYVTWITAQARALLAAATAACKKIFASKAYQQW
jgi:hypothetical protein